MVEGLIGAIIFAAGTLFGAAIVTAAHKSKEDQ